MLCATDCPDLRNCRAALTKLDISRRFDSNRGLHRYKLDGKEIDHLPAGEGAQARLEPIYETIEGWKQPTANARSWRPAGPGDQICPPGRGAGGCPIALLSPAPGT